MKKEELKPAFFCFSFMENGQDYLPCRDLSSIHLREEVDAIYHILFEIMLPRYQYISLLPFLFKKSKAIPSSEQLLT